MHSGILFLVKVSIHLQVFMEILQMEEIPSTVSCTWKDHFISGLAAI